MSYNKFWINRCIGIMGRNGRNALANTTLNIFPKLELAVIFMYLLILPNVFLPSSTPSSNTIKSFSNKIISALSLAISTAESTDIPMSDWRNAPASLIPSPKNPTVLPCSCNREMICVFCNGVSFENKVVSFTAFFNVVSSIFSISIPVRKWLVSIPTCRAIAFTTTSLSPDRIFTATPCAYNCSMASAAEGFGGSRKARYPISTISFSSSMAKLQSFSIKLFWETANTLIPCWFISSLIICALIFKASVKGWICPLNSA